MGEKFIRGCGWAALLGFAVTCWVGMALGTPTGLWLRLLSHFVSVAIPAVVLTSFLEEGLPLPLCLAAYGALLGVAWGGAARVIRFAVLNGELYTFPEKSHLHLPPDWWQSSWFWPRPIFIVLLLITAAFAMIWFTPKA